MSLYTDIRDGVFVFTKRPTLTAETDLAIRQALRKAHRAGSFPRDLVTVANIPVDTTQTVQSIALSSYCPRMRQLYVVKPTGLDVYYKDDDVRSLLDLDGYPKTDIYWQIGDTLSIRPANSSPTVDIIYYSYPDYSDLTTLSDWIAMHHQDLIVLWATMAVCAIINETEVSERVSKLVEEAYEDLMEEAVEIIGR